MVWQSTLPENHDRHSGGALPGSALRFSSGSATRRSRILGATASRDVKLPRSEPQQLGFSPDYLPSCAGSGTLSRFRMGIPSVPCGTKKDSSHPSFGLCRDRICVTGAVLRERQTERGLAIGALKGSVNRSEHAAVFAGVSSRPAWLGAGGRGGDPLSGPWKGQRRWSDAPKLHILSVDDKPRSLYALKELPETPEQSPLAQSGEEGLRYAGAAERLSRSEDNCVGSPVTSFRCARKSERISRARSTTSSASCSTGLKMEVAWLAKRLRADQRLLREKTDSMSQLIDSAVPTVRKIATGLRPEMLDDMGLVAAVGWQAKEFQKRTGIRCRVNLPPEP